MTKDLLALQAATEAVAILAESSAQDYATNYVRLKMDFCLNHQNSMIFSTRFGASFFEQVAYWLPRKDFLEPPKGEKLGDYDINFNKWLRDMRASSTT